MPKYSVQVGVLVTYDVEVEADDEDAAQAEVEEMSAPDIDEQGQYRDTTIEVHEIEELDEED